MLGSIGRLVLASGLGLAGATEEAGSRWAVIAAGSSGFWNYRHQADACHAYHVMRKSGIPASNIILMMQDDVANSSMNPFPGQLFNKPGDDPVDVYEGCQVDYRGSIVTADLFVKVITGDDSNLPKGGSGKVLKSKATDRVFLNFVDHGGVGIVAFPNGPVLYAKDLSKALQAMQAKQMFKEMVFYMEACESGSMFPDLKKDGKIFAVTAANAQESSWGYYCGSDAKVKGKSIGSCLGDLFSISWLEDSDLGNFSETVQTQVERVTKRTNKSHVMTFGDLSLESENIGSSLASPELSTVAESMQASTAYNVRDIPLHTAYSRWAHAEAAHEKAREFDALQRVVANRAADEAVFRSFSQAICGDRLGCGLNMASSKMQLTDYDCHKALASIVQESCPRREEHNSGGWNGFNMKYSQMLVNFCESRDVLQKSTEDLAQTMHNVCNGVASVVSAEQILV